MKRYIPLLVVIAFGMAYAILPFIFDEIDHDAEEAYYLLEGTVGVSCNRSIGETIDFGEGGIRTSTRPMEISSLGSGAIVGYSKDDDTIIVTAEHVCHTSDGDKDLEVRSPFVNAKIGWVTLTNDIHVTDIKGRVFLGIIFREDTYDDMCVLIVSGHMGHSSDIADELPPTGARIIHTGAPVAMFGRSLGAVIDGRFMGVSHLEGGRRNLSAMSLPIAQGSSGGPVWYRGRIIGIVLSTHRPTGNITWAVELDKLRTMVSTVRAALN